MRSLGVGIPILAALAVLQSTVLAQFTLLDGRADVILVAVLCWAMAGRGEDAMVWGLVGGLLLDLFSAVPFGSTAMILILLAYLVSLLRAGFWEANLLLPLGVVLAASIIFHGWGIGTMLVLGRAIDLPQAVARVVIPSTLLNLALAIPATQLTVYLNRALFPPEVTV
ncbi:MAG: rod shape-determining protein MreD [Anaerolineales bacterium]